jgi:hypothetical protein
MVLARPGALLRSFSAKIGADEDAKLDEALANFKPADVGLCVRLQ